MKVKIKVETSAGSVYTGRAFEVENMNDDPKINEIKELSKLDYFWFVDSEDNIISFNVANIAAVKIEKAKKYWLF